MSISFHCPTCNLNIRVQDSAAGKKGKCTSCGTFMRIPDSSAPAPAPSTVHPENASGQASANINRPCPFCGESILPTAKKCRHCGEFLDARPHGIDKETATPTGRTGKEAYEKARVASGHAIQALQVIASNPVGGLVKSLDLLGDAKALQAGVVFIVVFLVLAFWSLYSYYVYPLVEFAKAFEQESTVSVEMYMGILLISAIPPVALVAAYTCTIKVFGSSLEFAKIIFTVGVELLFVALVLGSLILLGIGNIELIAVIGIFSVCMVILLINTSLFEVFGLSAPKAAFLTPAIILLVTYITKVILSSIIFK